MTAYDIPVTLHDSLMARLDRLGWAKEVIQIGSVFGGEFSYELLHAVHQIAEADLQEALRNLADAEILYVRGIPPEATYTFRHALIRDAAYEALLRSRRRDLHRLVARVIDEKFAGIKDARPEVIAQHWTEAGEIEPAIAQWSLAGKTAEMRDAFREALESYRQAVTLLTRLPESPERDGRELELRQSIVWMLNVTRGYAAPETVAAIEHAASLAEKTGNLVQLGNLVRSRCLTAFIAGELNDAGIAANQALELALREGNPTSLAEVYALQLPARYWRGDLAGVERHFEAGQRFFQDPAFRQSRTGAAIAAFAYAGWNAWMLGRADIARERIAKVTEAVDASGPFDAAFSGYLAATLQVFLRRYEQAQALAARGLELSEEHQFPHNAALCRCVLGQALAQLGHGNDGTILISQGIAGLLKAGTRSAVTNLKRLKRLKKRSAQILTNSYTDLRFSDSAACCGSNMEIQKRRRPTCARRS
jgi:tetratricopeptide (TPR) repeat protein